LAFVSYLLWPLWDEQKQGLQDKMFGTHVFDAQSLDRQVTTYLQADFGLETFVLRQRWPSL
jgi:hypothetical protein